MVSKNTRYMVTVNDPVAHFLASEAKSKKTSVSKVILDLIEQSIDLREDYELSRLAEESEKRCEGIPTTSANEVWRQCGLE